MMKISETGKNLIRHYESLHDGDLSKIGLQWKKCPAGIVTVGYGHALFHEGQPIKSFEYARKIYPELENIDTSKADELLEEDLMIQEHKIYRLIKRPILQWEFDSLGSYFLNIGQSNTMVALVNAKANAKEITDWFVSHYITAEGKFLQGLLYRRQTEALLYTTGQLKFYNV